MDNNSLFERLIVSWVPVLALIGLSAFSLFAGYISGIIIMNGCTHIPSSVFPVTYWGWGILTAMASILTGVLIWLKKRWYYILLAIFFDLGLIANSFLLFIPIVALYCK
jgi:hypothetical protein